MLSWDALLFYFKFNFFLDPKKNQFMFQFFLFYFFSHLYLQKKKNKKYNAAQSDWIEMLDKQITTSYETKDEDGMYVCPNCNRK